MACSPARRPFPQSRLSLLVPMVLVACGLVGPGDAHAQGHGPTSVHEALRAQVEQLRLAPKSPVRGRQLMMPLPVAAFFEARGFVPPWTVPAAAATILDVVRAADRDGLTPRDYHQATIESLLDERSASPSIQLDADLQVLLTDALAALVDHVRYGKVRPWDLDSDWNVDPRFAAPPMEALLEQVASAPSPRSVVEGFVPNHFIYVGLKGALARYREIAARGGWPTITAGPTIKPGGSDPRVVAVRKRLAVTGEVDAHATTDDPLYDAGLEAAVQKFQERHRLKADGELGKATIDAMNVPVQARIDQIRVNLERIRWVVAGLRDSFILVNLPAFKTYVIRDTRNVWETRVQIGKQARQTPSFHAEMRYIVFNPDWTVPPTILREDVLKPMAQGNNAIKRKGLTVVDRDGRLVDPATIDWKKASASNFPYTLRQPPGASNALGRVKFMFPNEHSIFLHDTPSRELFSADTRTFSSGCIRVEHPLELAAVLLEGTEGWTPERIQQVIASGKSETVFLKSPLEVLIVYWTVSVGASGELRFARDVYGQDPGVLRALDLAAAARTE